jgi:hypothetical protein
VVEFDDGHVIHVRCWPVKSPTRRQPRDLPPLSSRVHKESNAGSRSAA